MKKLMFVAVLCLALSLSGCTQHTELGECYGLLTTHKAKPDLVYEYDIGNIIIAALFSETVIVPIIVGADLIKCPVAKAQ